ncbi:ADP-ribosyl cyclase/cyclic ADP-ribose hydrolase 1 isoform X1 [Labrus mixtus]|uniref:ADP-ribosyl cyclase/cyclic ADP-ribose hydrolase 1 isoform X1 n=2 Tax=Labrus mixtus TaxID=508554 RepID=UPI0029C07FBE|nr:ADP-ribosyl cyclase/cyclic ADP-ribose hydrolase 1 isoform X1 [Labrus mixtus]
MSVYPWFLVFSCLDFWKLRHVQTSRFSEVMGLTIMNAHQTSASFVMIRVTVWFFILLFCPGPLSAQLGTTPNIKHIVVGRCYNYITLVNPSSRHDCEDIWRHFEEAVVRQSSCNVRVEDYHPMFFAMPQTLPCDRFLFWSKTRVLMHSYAAVVGQFWTLEDTLVGYMFNDLIWCGQEEDSDFDFSSCPEWSACRNHPVYSLWRQASQNFAEMACGNITVLLNGSIVNAFNKKSMFGSVELDSLNPHRVDYVNIKVVTNLEGPIIESCGKGSIVDLIQILQSRGFRWTCTDDDQTLMILQCIQNPEQPSCQTYANSLRQKKSLTLD